jgi:hypothetical protein
MMLGNLSSNRYWVYGLLAFFSWTSFNYFYVRTLNLVVAKLSASSSPSSASSSPTCTSTASSLASSSGPSTRA